MMIEIVIFFRAPCAYKVLRGGYPQRDRTQRETMLIK
jgi:hypothetical protein